MQHIQGPDFPTGGTIMGRAGIRQEEEGGEQDAGNGKPAEEPVLDAGQVHEGAP